MSTKWTKEDAGRFFEAAQASLQAMLDVKSSRLAEALSQRQAAVEEAERLREEKRFLIETDWDVTRKVQQERDRLERELAAANQDARLFAQHVLSILDRSPCSCCPDGLHDTPTGLLASARRLASQPPAEAEGA